MRSLKKIFCIAAVLLFVSCGKEDTQKTRQENYIEAIVSSLQKDAPQATVRYSKGSTIVTTVQGEGEELASSGTVAFYYDGYYISSGSINPSNLFATNSKETAESLMWNLSDTTVFKADTVRLSGSSLVKGLKNGLVGVKSGEECYIMFSSEYGFGKNMIGNIPDNSALAYHLRIISVANK